MKPIKINGVPFNAVPWRVFQVYDARNRCIGCWETLPLALHWGLATHPAGYLVHCDDFRGWGMQGYGSFYRVGIGVTPGPTRTRRVPGFEGRITADMRRRVAAAIAKVRSADPIS